MNTTPKNTETTTPAISLWRRSLHWLTAVLVVSLLALGLWMTRADVSTPEAVSASIWRFSLHKTVGVVVVVLTVIRLVSMWLGSGFTHSQHSPLETLAARAIQAYFLTALIALPVTGLVMHYFASGAAPIWGVADAWSHSAAPDPAKVSLMAGVHHFLAWGMLIALFLHVAGALKHHIVDKDATLKRMLVSHPASTTHDELATSERSPQRSSQLHARLGQAIGASAVIVLGLAGALFHASTPSGASPSVNIEVQSGDYRSVPESSRLVVKAVQGGDAFEAAFGHFEVTVTGQGDHPPTSISVSIDSGSFSSGLDDRDATATGSDWLDATQFPVSTYVTTQITTNPTGAEFPLSAQGELTIREIMANVSIDFSFEADDADPKQHRLIGRAEFDRFDVELGRGDFGGEDAADRTINVEFDITLTPGD